jgi:hypothetical protein
MMSCCLREAFCSSCSSGGGFVSSLILSSSRPVSFAVSSQHLPGSLEGCLQPYSHPSWVTCTALTSRWRSSSSSRWWTKGAKVGGAGAGEVDDLLSE